ncbi:glycosyltransferase family 87 protein [Geomonas subterranea]|uniref:DUF2029 domain-containing protein n=1 Tax=Geomonas subterranea TaxID=2847989 RepID=A0ABX8LEJ6_9BACT|nr:MULTISPECIES: glycosyltransferase family 87 protein [Geomonas]QXE90468.1 DUF2029 domain-containing protein [Geomonas subterranea]QXM11456.1 DUF2029 domain-containing protein [Geomonas subterranea]
MKVLKLVLVAMVILGGIYSAWDKYETSIAIDFYQMWGIGNAMKASGGSLTSPYLAKDKYGKTLDKVCDATPDERLQAANKVNHQLYDFGLEPTASPLLFTVFALFPQDYSQSYGIFLALDLFLFAFSTILLFYRRSTLFSFLILLFAVFLFEPFRSDLNLGNVNLLQYSAVSIGLYYAEKLKSATREGSFQLSLFLAILVFATLLKPNLALIAIAFTGSLLFGRKRDENVRSAAVLCGSVVILMIAPCIYFKSFAIWEQWLNYITATGKLNFELFSGNLSTIALISFLTGQPYNAPFISIGVLTALLLVVLLCSTSRSIRDLITGADSSVSMAIVVTLALSPLVWWHYYLMLLNPIIWLVNNKPKFPVHSALGVLSLLLASNVVSLIDRNLYLYNVYIVPSCWIPLLIGILITCRWRGSRSNSVAA